ncbi:MAG: DUF2304 domain-containing protein [Actinomycetaceae bacterium]|nr:DUF2304 domain-containing protein [Actinomycetaceae bacterium]
MLIKTVLILGILIIGMLIFKRNDGSDKALAYRRIGITCFTVGALIAVIWPSITSKIASVLGVGRGTDLLVYLVVLAILANIAMTSRKDNNTRKQITRLARQIAILNAQVGEGASCSSRVAADVGGAVMQTDTRTDAGAENARYKSECKKHAKK